MIRYVVLPDTPVLGVALNNKLPPDLVTSKVASCDELNMIANSVESIEVPSLIAKTFCD